jgi:dissimilatory sulfite reductase (desulfoviridin) alpha/beta subunit
MATDGELIQALKKRGIAVVIGIVTQDEDTGLNKLRMALHHSGQIESALWAAANMVECVWTHCEDAGWDPKDLCDIVEDIVYDPSFDLERDMPEEDT